MFVIKSAAGYLRRRPYHGYSYHMPKPNQWTPDITKARVFSNRANVSNCINGGGFGVGQSVWKFPVSVQEVKIQEV